MKEYTSKYPYLPTLNQLKKNQNFKPQRGQCVYDEELKQVKCFDGEAWLDYTDVFESKPIKFKYYSQDEYDNVHSVISAYNIFVYYDFQQIFAKGNNPTFNEIRSFLNGKSEYEIFFDLNLQRLLDLLNYSGLISVSEKGSYSLKKNAYEALNKIIVEHRQSLVFPKSIIKKAEIFDIVSGPKERQFRADLLQYHLDVLKFRKTLYKTFKEEGWDKLPNSDALMEQKNKEFRKNYFSKEYAKEFQIFDKQDRLDISRDSDAHWIIKKYENNVLVLIVNEYLYRSGLTDMCLGIELEGHQNPIKFPIIKLKNRFQKSIRIGKMIVRLKCRDEKENVDTRLTEIRIILGTITEFSKDSWQTVIEYHNKLGFIPQNLAKAMPETSFCSYIFNEFASYDYKGYLLNQRMVRSTNKLVESVISDYFGCIKKLDNSIFEKLIPLIKSKTVDVYIPNFDYDTLEETHNERTKVGGLPYLLSKNDWPTCKFCGIRQELVFQLNSSNSPVYTKNDLFQHFSCLNYKCKTGKPRLDKYYQRKSDYFRSIKVRGASYVPPNKDKPKVEPIYLTDWKRMKRLPRLEELGDMELSRDEVFFLKKKLVNETQYNVFSGKPYWNEYDVSSDIDHPLPPPPFCNYEDNDLNFLYQFYYKINAIYTVYVFQYKESKEYVALWYN